jgi:hypothetical protein
MGAIFRRLGYPPANCEWTPEVPMSDVRVPSPAAGHNARRGAVLLLLYVALYGSFLALLMFCPAAIRDTSVPLQHVGSGQDSLDVLHLDLHGLNLAMMSGLLFVTASVFLAFFHVRPEPPAGPAA